MVFDSLVAAGSSYHCQYPAFLSCQAVCFVPPSASSFWSSSINVRYQHNNSPSPITPRILHHNSLPTSLKTTDPDMQRRRLYMSRHSNGHDDDDSIGEQLYNALFLDNSAVVYPLLLGALSLTVLPFSTSLLAAILYVVYSFLGTTVVLEDYLDERRSKDDGDDAFDDFADNPPPVNFVAFVAALLTAGILTPLDATQQQSGLLLTGSIMASSGDGVSVTPLLLLGAVGIGATASTWILRQDHAQGSVVDEDNSESSSSLDELPDARDSEKRLMELWDEQLQEKITSQDDDPPKE